MNAVATHSLNLNKLFYEGLFKLCMLDSSKVHSITGLVFLAPISLLFVAEIVCKISMRIKISKSLEEKLIMVV